MAPFGRIYSYPDNHRVLRAQAIAALNGLEVVADPDFKFGVDNKKPEFLAKFPLGKVPAFEGADGFCLAEGAAIATYLAGAGPRRDQLLGGAADPKAKAKIAEWTLFTETELVAHSTPPFIMGVVKFWPWDAERYAAAAASFERAVGKLEATVKGGRKFLVGEALTLADLMVASALWWSSGFLFDAEMRKKAPETVEYLKGIVAVPEFKAAFGDLKLCEARVKAA